ncbi:MAG: hypothetical protein ACFFAJ_05745 [Candidatus Hodarchaeota archaeon]
MSRESQPIDKIRHDLQAEVHGIQIFATSVIFSAAAVASSTVLLFIPNLETISLFLFLVGYRYGRATGFMTVLTTVTIYEMFASQVYGTGGIIPFLLKFPPYFLIMLTGVYFHTLKIQSDSRSNDNQSSSPLILETQTESIHQNILYQPQKFHQWDDENNFTLYERLLLVQLGFALTIVFDIITSLGILVFVPTWEAFFISFVVGIPFIVFHQITNSILFATIPSIITALNNARPGY